MKIEKNRLLREIHDHHEEYQQGLKRKVITQ